MFSRATSIPAATSSASRSGLEDAGPSVQTIFARRLMLIAFQMGHLAFPGKAPELVYTTLDASVLAAESHNARFTEQSSDVTQQQHGRLRGRRGSGPRPRRAGPGPRTPGTAAPAGH